MTVRLTIRRARAADAPGLSWLAGELGYPAKPAELRERLERLRRRPDHLVLVLEGPGAILGWVHVLVREELESPRHAELAGLVVGSPFRRLGLGRALVDNAALWAARQGVPRLRVRVNVVRRGAGRFYARLGFLPAKRQAVLDRPLAVPRAARARKPG